MANTDFLRGFYPVRHLNGAPVMANEYIVTTGAIIYRGDLVSMAATGTVGAAVANDGIVVIGVAAEYVSDSGSAGGKKILIFDDPHIVFGVQCVTGYAIAATEVFVTANHIAGAGSAVTKLSGHELNSGAGNQMRVLGLVKTVDNAWGEHAEVEVLLVEHALADNTTI